jgi:hypothetical protein
MSRPFFAAPTLSKGKLKTLAQPTIEHYIVDLLMSKINKANKP